MGALATTTIQCDQPGTLMKTTYDLLRQDERTLLEIYEATGIPFYWLRKFYQNEFRNPSVNRVQYLYEHLTGKKLL